MAEHAASTDESAWRAGWEQARACEQRHDWTGALALYEKLSAALPGTIGAADVLRLRLRVAANRNRVGQVGAAETLYRDLIAGFPAFPEAHVEYGNFLHGIGRAVEARDCFKRALDIAPDLLPALNNYGLISLDLGELDSARQALDHVLARAPDAWRARYNRALLDLMEGRFEQAWDHYGLRLRQRLGTERPKPFPEWDGRPLPDQSLLIVGEQGLGDELTFASMFGDVAALCPHRVIECDKRLVPLLERSFPGVRAVGRDKTAEPRWETLQPPIAFWTRMGDLPGRFRRSLSSFPASHRYLRADLARVEFWRDKLAALGPGLKVGISWRGGLERTHAAYRSIPLQEWAPILQQRGVQFINLQYTNARDELAALRSATGVEITTWAGAINNYDETAALVAALDVVISVQTSVVRLASALGKPVWVLTPRCAGWIYIRGQDHTPWLPTARLFWQETLGEWQPVINDVAAALNAHVRASVVSHTKWNK